MPRQSKKTMNKGDSGGAFLVVLLLALVTTLFATPHKTTSQARVETATERHGSFGRYTDLEVKSAGNGTQHVFVTGETNYDTGDTVMVNYYSGHAGFVIPTDKGDKNVE